MPFTMDAVIQGYGTASVGSFNATSGSATLPNATTAGNTIVVAVGSSGGLDVAMSGFTRATGAAGAGSQRGGVFIKPADGASSWTITVSSAQPTVWAAYEVEGVDAEFPVETAASWGCADFALGTHAASVSPFSTTYDGLMLGVFFGSNTTGTTVPVWSNFHEETTASAADYAVLSTSTRVEASTAFGMTVVAKPAQEVRTYQPAASVSPSVWRGSGAVMLNMAGARHSSRIDAMCGFETGTTLGITTGVAGYAPFDAIAGSPAVVSTAPRSGVYCAELSASAATEYLSWTSAGLLGMYEPLTPSQLVVRFSVYFPASLPAGDVELFSLGTAAQAQACVVRYRTSGTRLGMKVNTGTEQFTGAVAADTWYDVDVRFSVATTTWTAYWMVGGMIQADATLSGQSASVLTFARFGWATAATATVRYDDLALSKVPGHYPLGDLRIYPLKVDPSSTVVIYAFGSPDPSSEGNFQTFTANGTLAAWNATTAKNAIDDIPPTIGASADGIAQITPSSARMRIQMETYTGGSAEVIRAVRWYFCGWAGAATANNVAIFGLVGAGGSFTRTLFAVGDPGFDNSTTTPGWVCRMHRGGLASEPDEGFVWTQAYLDTLACEIGASTDATPDVGVHAVLAEVCMRAVESVPVFGQPGGLPRVEQDVDSDSGGIAALRVYTDTGQTGTLTWYNAAGSPTPVSIAAASNPQTITLNAADVPSTPRLEFVIT